MDGLRFVLEAPQLSQTHKKRPRLVTSCDNCRLKKIKCVQVKSQPRCEACEAGNTPFTGASAGPSPAHSRRSSTQSIEPSAASPTRGDSVDASGWYSGAQASSIMDIHHAMHRVRPRTASRRHHNQIQINGSHLRSWDPRDLITRGGFVFATPFDPTHLTLMRAAGNTHTLLPYLSSETAILAVITLLTLSRTHRAHKEIAWSTKLLPLFDSRQVNMPHPTILVHLVQVFFECFARNFPFLQYDDVSRRVFNGTLSPLLANSIASLAARYSQSSDVLTRGATAVSTAYADTAK
ncbi:hypothetical protein EDB85DRAFT_2221934, partial [Lactarius pseudohatsudake]